MKIISKPQFYTEFKYTSGSDIMRQKILGWFIAFIAYLIVWDWVSYTTKEISKIDKDNTLTRWQKRFLKGVLSNPLLSFYFYKRIFLGK